MQRLVIVFAGVVGLTLAACGQPGRQAPAPGESLVPLPSEQPAPRIPAAQASAVATHVPAPTPATDAPADCGASKLGAYLDQLPTTEAMDKIRKVIGHDRIRAINPGDAVTQDLRPDRLNIEIGANGRIKQFRCY